MNNRYDVMILGTGEAGIFAAYELSRKCPNARVLVVEQGADIVCRVPPALLGYRHVGMRCRVGPRRLLPVSFLDHLPGRYYMAMFRELPGS